jgi:hypothetical protein
MGGNMMIQDPAIIVVRQYPLKIRILHVMHLPSIIILSERYRAG